MNIYKIYLNYIKEAILLFKNDFNHTFEQADNSILVYPAWYNIHGVTKIIQHNENAYRNSLIFYPLKGFDK